MQDPDDITQAPSNSFNQNETSNMYCTEPTAVRMNENVALVVDVNVPPINVNHPGPSGASNSSSLGTTNGSFLSNKNANIEELKKDWRPCKRATNERLELPLIVGFKMNYLVYKVSILWRFACTLKIIASPWI